MNATTNKIESIKAEIRNARKAAMQASMAGDHKTANSMLAECGKLERALDWAVGTRNASWSM